MTGGDVVVVVLFAAGACTPAVIGFQDRWSRARKPMCAHCRKRIRDGAVLTTSQPAGSVIIETTWHLNRPECRAAARWDRTAVYPNGDAPDGCCNVCGMHDPEQLVDGSHEECVEWLGRRVESLAARRLRNGTTAVNEARTSLAKAPCAHERTEDIYTYGAGHWKLCRDCGADVGPVEPNWANFTAEGMR